MCRREASVSVLAPRAAKRRSAASRTAGVDERVDVLVDVGVREAEEIGATSWPIAGSSHSRAGARSRSDSWRGARYSARGTGSFPGKVTTRLSPGGAWGLVSWCSAKRRPTLARSARCLPGAAQMRRPHVEKQTRGPAASVGLVRELVDAVRHERRAELEASRADLDREASEDGAGAGRVKCADRGVFPEHGAPDRGVDRRDDGLEVDASVLREIFEADRVAAGGSLRVGDRGDRREHGSPELKLRWAQ